MKDAELSRLLDTPCPRLAFSVVQSRTLPNSTIQRQTEAIKHILPRQPAAASTQPAGQVPQSARPKGRPPAAPTPSPGPVLQEAIRRHPRPLQHHPMLNARPSGAPETSCSGMIVNLRWWLPSLPLEHRPRDTPTLYVAAIAAHHDTLEGNSVEKQDLVVRFLRGARRLNPSRDLSVVLTAPQSAPFEPLQSVEIKFLSMLVALHWFSLDSGCHCFGIPAARSTVAPLCDCPLHPECGILFGSSAWCIANRHLQSCRLGDTQYFRHILQSPSGACVHSCTCFKQLVLDLLRCLQFLANPRIQSASSVYGPSPE
ncbi:hypothetical protein F2P79_008741 [Pimephales promelas]|nr:hypothetical protein F2P79_008741 [Pimephales promelas]